MSRIVAFYRGDGRDHRGRTLSDIHAFDFDELELNHDYIQWLFPLPEPSGVNASAPLLSNADIDLFQSDDELRARLLQSFELLLRFLGLEPLYANGAVSVRRAPHFDERRQNWLHAGNHNFLRLSRILRSLTLLGCSQHSYALLVCLEDIYACSSDTIGTVAIGYWRRAVTPSRS